MAKIFSFCLYGNQKKYCQGLLENIKLINEYYPDFEIWIACGDDVPLKYLEEFINYFKIYKIIYDL